MVIEGVPYLPFLIRFSTTDGKRRVKTIWCPGPGSAENPWLGEAVDSYLDDRSDVDASKRVLVRLK